MTDERTTRLARLLSGALLALAPACGSTGSDPGPPAPDPGPETVHELSVSRHATVALSGAEADAIAAEMGNVLQGVDGPGDVACDVGFRRLGSVGEFALGTGIINSQADFEAVNGLPGNVKVVRQINWCGTLAPNIIGCAPVPGESLVVVRFTSGLEGILWVHEFGHNQGLEHREAPGAVMSPFIDPTHRQVNGTECDAYER